MEIFSVYDPDVGKMFISTNYNAPVPACPYLDYVNDDGDVRYVTLKSEVHSWMVDFNIMYSLDYGRSIFKESFKRSVDIIFDTKENAVLFKLTWIGQ
jgi:hypothetical protein